MLTFTLTLLSVLLVSYLYDKLCFMIMDFWIVFPHKNPFYIADEISESYN